MNIKNTTRLLTALFAVVVLLIRLPAEAQALSKPSQAGEKVLSGGQRDFRWPVPGQYGLSSCFLDQRRHYAIDISAPKGSTVIASYGGTVVATYNGCSHNYGGDCGCGFGNYVIMQHSYALKSGEHITLYTRYAHLTKATVSVGDVLSAGQQVGTVGSTGLSTGHHLDFQILRGGYTPYRSYSIDPYINELLELPEGIWNALGSYCCGKYIEYIKDLYPRCTHDSFNAQGLCTGCGFNYDWRSTKSTSGMGNYTVNAGCSAAATPYTAALGTAGTLAAGATVSVSGTVVNGLGESWYEISLSGTAAYLPKSALTFQSYLESQYDGAFTSLSEGQMLKPQPYTLSGWVSSRYPLKTLSAYLDGSLYATWSGNASQVSLAGTDINNKLYFSHLAPGSHTLQILAEDITGRAAQKVLEVRFSVRALHSYTVTLDPSGGACEVSSVTVREDGTLGQLPAATLAGHRFSGWFDAAGQAVQEGAAISESTTLYARFVPETLTVILGEQSVSLSYGQTLPSLPQFSLTGHRFLGWFTAEKGGTLWPPETPVTENMTLYPQFAPLSFTVTLDAGLGKVYFNTKAVSYGGCYGILPEPISEGHRFAGWYLGDTAITNATLVLTEADHILTARWEALPSLQADEPESETSGVIAFSTAVLCLLLGSAVLFFTLRPVRFQKPEEVSGESTPAE